MEALRQYIDLWDGHRQTVERNSPEALNTLRDEAARILRQAQLPRKGTAEYACTDLQEDLAPDYGLNLARIPMDVDPSASFRCEVPRLSTSLFFLVNDIFAAPKGARNGLPEGIEIMSLREMADKDPEFVKAHYGRLADLRNPLVALDTLFCQDGMAVRVRAGVKVEKPVQLVSILSSLMPYMAVRRILIVLEEGAELSLLACDHTQVADVRLAALQTVEIFAGRGSRLDYCDLEETTEQTARLSTLWLSQEEGSRVTLDGVTLFNGHTRNEYHTVFRGRGAELRLLGMAIEDGDRRLETYSRIEHAAPGCKTDELFKYIVDDRAAGSFIGRIKVDEGAVGTEAYQSNRNLVGSDQARMHSKPELEIYNDDVKCSHGSATGQLDERQIFYMRTRGLSLDEARLLLRQAFMADVLEAIALPPLAERLRHLVDMRIAGVLTSSCSGCHSCSLQPN